MPRELLLPIPYDIADKVHQMLLNEGDYLMDAAVAAKTGDDRTTQIATARELKTLADKLDTLARKAGVIGW